MHIFGLKWMKECILRPILASKINCKNKTQSLPYIAFFQTVALNTEYFGLIRQPLHVSEGSFFACAGHMQRVRNQNN